MMGASDSNALGLCGYAEEEEWEINTYDAANMDQVRAAIQEVAG